MQVALNTTENIANNISDFSDLQSSNLNEELLTGANNPDNGFMGQMLSVANQPTHGNLLGVATNMLDEMQTNYKSVKNSISVTDTVNSPEKMLSLQMQLDEFSLSTQLISKGVGVVTKDIDTLVHIQ